MAEAADLLVRIDATTEQLRRELARAQTQVDQSARVIDQRVKRVDDRFAALTRNVARAAAALGVGLSVREFVRFADAATQVENRLRLVTSGTEELASVQRQLFDVSQRTRSEFTATADLYGRLALSAGELGVSQQELIGFTEGIGQALAISGTSAQTASGALQQLGQALGAGTVRAEEFNSILEGSPRIAQAVAVGLDEAGGSVARLRQLVIEGEVSSRAFFDAFQEQLPQLAEEFARTDVTIGGGFTRINNSLIALVGAFNETSGASAGIAQALTAISAGIDVLAQNIDRIVITAGTAAAVFGGAYVASLAVAAARTLTLAGALATLRGAIIRTGIGALVVAAGELVFQFTRIVENTGSVGAAFEALGRVAADIWEGVSQSVQSAAQSVQSAAENVIASVLEFAEAPARLVGDLINRIVIPAINTLAQSVDNVINPVLRALGREAATVGRLIEIDLGQSVASTAAEMREAAEVSAGFAELLGGNASRAFERARAALAELTAATAENGSTNTQTGQAAEELAAALAEVEAASGSGSNASRQAAAATAALGSALGTTTAAAGPMQRAVEGVGDALTQSIGDALTGSLDSLESFSDAVINTLSRLAADVLRQQIVVPIVGQAFGGGVAAGAGSAVGSAATGIPSAANAAGLFGNLGNLSLLGSGGATAGTAFVQSGIGQSLGLSSATGSGVFIGQTGGVVASGLNNLANPLTGLGGLAGNFGADLIFGNDRGIGSSAGGALGGLAGGAFLGPLGALGGAFLGNAVGGLFGNNEPSNREQGFGVGPDGVRQFGQTGDKFDEELRGAIDSIGASLAAAVAASGGTLSRELDVSIGRRDPSLVRAGGNVAATTAVGDPSALLEASFDVLADELAQTVPEEVARVIRSITADNIGTAVSDIAFAKALTDGSLFPDPVEISAIQSVIEQLNAEFGAMRDTAERLQLPVEAIDDAAADAMFRLANEIGDNLQREIRALEGRGYINAIGDLVKDTGTAIEDALALGLDPNLLVRRFELQVSELADGLDVSELADLSGEIERLADLSHFAAEGLEPVQTALDALTAAADETTDAIDAVADGLAEALQAAFGDIDLSLIERTQGPEAARDRALSLLGLGGLDLASIRGAGSASDAASSLTGFIDGLREVATTADEANAAARLAFAEFDAAIARVDSAQADLAREADALTANLLSLTSAFDGLIADITDSVAQATDGLRRETERTLEGLARAGDDVFRDITSLRDNFLQGAAGASGILDSLSTLSTDPMGAFAATQGRFRSLANAAAGGDAGAVSALGTGANSFLDAARQFFPEGTGEFAAAVEEVQRAAERAQASALSQANELQARLEGQTAALESRLSDLSAAAERQIAAVEATGRATQEELVDLRGAVVTESRRNAELLARAIRAFEGGGDQDTINELRAIRRAIEEQAA